MVAVMNDHREKAPFIHSSCSRQCVRTQLCHMMTRLASVNVTLHVALEKWLWIPQASCQSEWDSGDRCTCRAQEFSSTSGHSTYCWACRPVYRDKHEFQHNFDHILKTLTRHEEPPGQNTHHVGAAISFCAIRLIRRPDKQDFNAPSKTQ